MIHKRLKFLREQKALSQEKVAEAMHMTQNTYSRIETGKTRIYLEMAYRFAVLYKVSLYELINDDSSFVNSIEKVKADFINNILTQNDYNKETIDALKEQLTTKDKQIERLLKIIESRR